MPVFTFRKQFFTRPHLWLITLIGVIAPRRWRADWRKKVERLVAGREFSTADLQSAAKVAVVSESLWLTRFRGRRVGRRGWR